MIPIITVRVPLRQATNIKFLVCWLVHCIILSLGQDDSVDLKLLGRNSYNCLDIKVIELPKSSKAET